MNPHATQPAVAGATPAAEGAVPIGLQQPVDYRALLNEAQYQAVTTTEGSVLVIAGAGSGKTRTLVHRAAYLVDQGVVPESILLLTFTRKAAQDMMQRAAQILDERCARIAGGTFHSFANIILRSFAPLLNYEAGFSIADTADAEGMMDIIRSQNVPARTESRYPVSSTLLAMRSKVINSGRLLADLLDEEYPQFARLSAEIEKMHQGYQAYKQTRAIMDYDDLLLNLATLLERHADVRARLSAQYRYIMVDEYQDTNPLQARIVYLLADQHSNVLACGDDAQSIYSFRGASFANIMGFPAHFAGCQVIKLEENYRSTQPILALSNAIIANMSEKYAKKLRSDQPSLQKPVYIQAADSYQEADFICRRVLDLHAQGIPLRELAVLFRAASHSSVLELALARRNIPFRKFGGLKFVELAHVKDFIAFLRIIANPKDEPAWMRVLKLHEGIGVNTAAEIMNRIIQDGRCLDALQAYSSADRKYSHELAQLSSLLRAAHEEVLSVGELAQRISVYYGRLLPRQYTDDPRRREEELRALVSMATQALSLERFLSDFALDPPAQGVIDAGGQEDYLVLSTIHTAKGLEWHAVFLMSLVEGCLPVSFAKKTAAIDEERRMFYVAATRARKELYLLLPAASASSRSGAEKPSRFLGEIKNLSTLTEARGLPDRRPGAAAG